MSKIHQKTLMKWSVRKIPANKGKSGEYRLAVRDLNGKWSKSEGAPEYILSNPTASGISPEKFKELERKLSLANLLKKSITIQFIKKFGKKFIQEVN